MVGPMELVAVVKSVEGGAITFYLNSDGPKMPERTLYLASVLVPQLCRRGSLNPDEPSAWEAREFLRTLLVSQRCKFRKEFTINERDYGSVFLRDETSIASSLVSKGLAKVTKQSSSDSLACLDYEELCRLEKEAQKASLGVWGAKSDGRGRVVYGGDDPHYTQKIAKSNDGQMLPGIVEYVRDGGFLKIFFPTLSVVADVALAGVICDGYKRDEFGVVHTEPFADEVKTFVASRLLQRNVEVRIESCDNYGTLFASIFRDGRNIGLRLLEVGLARINESRLRQIYNLSEMRSAMHSAQKSKLGVWEDWTPTVLEDVQDYEAKVVEIHSGDCFSVQLDDTDSERRLYLSCVRAPRLGGRDRADQPHAFDAKEFLRRQLIGRKVMIHVVSMRTAFANTGGGAPPPASDSSGRMHFVSVTLAGASGGKDLGCSLVDAGLARVMPSRKEEENALNLDLLLAAEAAATTAKKGLHSEVKNAGMKRIVQLLGVDNAERARSYEADLKKKNAIDAVVEHCFSPALFKLRIPSMSIAIRFHLGGIHAPEYARSGGVSQDEPFCREALQFSRTNLMQRTVSISVEGCERSGTFVGILRSNKQVFAARLVEEGLASVLDNDTIRSRTAIHEDLAAAEAVAKAANRGLWQFFVEKPVEETTQSFQPRELDSVRVVHIDSPTRFFIHTGPAKESQAIQEDIANGLDRMASYPEGKFPRKDDALIAQFQQDKEWYRAKVRKVDRDTGLIHVTFVDYGNESVVSHRDIRACPIALEMTNPSRPALAVMCALSGIKTFAEFLDEASVCLSEKCSDRDLSCYMEKMSRSPTPVVHVVLTDGENPDSINCELVSAGLVGVDRKSDSYIKAELLEHQALAKKGRIAIWTHGDPGDSSDDEA